MKNLSIISILLFTLSIFSCDKGDNTCDNPQYPGEYFPAYPNSSWIYKTNDNNTIQYKTSDKYTNCNEACRSLFLNANSCIQDNYLIDSYPIGQGFIGILESPIYTTILDSAFYCPHSFATFYKMPIVSDIEDVFFKRTLIAKDTSITIDSKLYSNVIIMNETDSRDTSFFYLDYFAKDIGLIKRDITKKDSLGNNTTNIMTLESYNIGSK